MNELPDDPKQYSYMGKPLALMSKEELALIVVELFKKIHEMRQDVNKIIELRHVIRKAQS